MFESIKAKALITVPPIVLLVVATFFTFGYFVTLILGIPFSFGLTLPVRLLALLVLVSGFSFFGWVFRYRKPTDVLVSTYVTFSKVKKRSPPEKPTGRTEPLVVQGPYRYVRHPLYFGVVLLVLGWWLLLDYSFLLVSAIFLLLWFNFVVAPFEEVELRAIFGEQYEQYSKEVPKIIPFTKHRKK
ncbi:MAG: methyltransferase family protein [Nitrososphaerales archaeon]